jgi:hypothetical protein
MKDLFLFVCFILIFLCAYSITSWSLINSASQVNWIYSNDGQLLNVTMIKHGNNSWSWQLLRNITHFGVWKVFAQVDSIGRCYFCDRDSCRSHLLNRWLESYLRNFWLKLDQSELALNQISFLIIHFWSVIIYV